MHRYIGIALGAIVSYLLLLLFHGGRFVGDPGTAYLAAVISGALVALLWPWPVAGTSPAGKTTRPGAVRSLAPDRPEAEPTSGTLDIDLDRVAV
jgi:hypothetical protein